MNSLNVLLLLMNVIQRKYQKMELEKLFFMVLRQMNSLLLILLSDRDLKFSMFLTNMYRFEKQLILDLWTAKNKGWLS